jgi:hypothetical protein
MNFIAIRCKSREKNRTAARDVADAGKDPI